MSKAQQRFELVELDGEECWCVKIRTGAYEDVVYKYNHVSVVAPDDGDGYATLKFNYEVLYHAELSEEKFARNSGFENLIGDILYDLIEMKTTTNEQDPKD
jgi:hypothetical protein